MNIIPAILPHNFQEIGLKLSRIKGFSNRVQINLCDGEFGAEKTWLPDGKEILPEDFLYEFDIMLNDWKVTTLECLALKAVAIVAHVDNFTDENQDMETLISMVAPHNVPLGISVSNDKGLDFHAEMIRKATSLYPNIFIQMMGIKNIGQQGQSFDEEIPGRIRALKQQFPDVLLQVDGGIHLDTIHLVKEAGADNVIVGSSVFGTDDAGESLVALKAVIVEKKMEEIASAIQEVKEI